MKKLILSISFILIGLSAFSQAFVKGTGVRYDRGVPTVAPDTTYGTELVYDLTNRVLYMWDRTNEAWVKQLSVTRAAGTPSGDPGNGPDMYINTTTEDIYWWNGSSWDQLNGASGGGDVTQAQLDDSTAAIRTDFPDISGLITQTQLNDSTAAIRADFPIPSTVDSTRLIQDSILVYYQGGAEIGRDTIPVSLGGGGGGGDVTSSQLADSTAAVRADFPSAADGTETIVTAGANINVSGDGSSGTPYVITGTGTGGGAAGYVTQSHVDSVGANGYDGLNDDVAFQAAWDTLTTNGYRHISFSPGASYDIRQINWSLYNSADTASQLIVDGNGVEIVLDTQTVNKGNIVVEGVTNIIFKDITFRSKYQLSSNPYNVNNSFVYVENTANVTFLNCRVVRPYSHGIRAADHKPTTGTERQGLNIPSMTFSDHLDNITEEDYRYSYILLEPGAEYNQFGQVDFYSGQSGVRGHGAANDTYANIVAEEMEIPSAFFDPDSIYQTGIIYYEISNPTSNSGKINIGDFTANHNNRVVPVVIKQEAGNDPPRPVKITNGSFLVNGADIALGEQMYLENCDNCSVTSVDFRPRQKPGSATIVLNNCKEFLFSNSSIFQTSGGIDGFELLNGSSVILSNPKLDVNNIVKSGSDGTIRYSTAKDAPVYEDIFAVSVDNVLGHGSLYRLEGQTSIQVKDTAATVTSFRQPVLVIDDSTYIEGWPITSAQELVEINQNEPNWSQKWKATRGFENTIRFSMDSVLTGNNQIWSGSGTNYIHLKFDAPNEVEIFYSTGAGTGTLTAVTGTTWAKDTWYTARTVFTEDDSVKVYVNGQLELADLVPGTFDITQNTNGFRIAPAINSVVGFNGKIDFFEWKSDGMIAPQRLQFGNYDPDIAYTTNGTKTGNDYRYDRLELPGLEVVVEDNVMKASLPSADGNGLIDDLPNGNVSINGSGNDLNITNAGTVYIEGSTIQLEGDLNLNQGSGTPTAGTGFTVGSVNIQRSAEIVCLSGSVGASADDTAITGGTTVILTLPTGYRPANTLVQPAFTNQVSDSNPQMFAWEISTNGEMKVLFSEGATFDLDTAEVLYLSGCFSTN